MRTRVTFTAVATFASLAPAALTPAALAPAALAVPVPTFNSDTCNSACIRYHNEVAGHKAPMLALPNTSLRLEGNFYGVGGHKTILSECWWYNGSSPLMSFGWNWTRGNTDRNCSEKCQAPQCYADFSFAGVSYGVGPWGGKNASFPHNMPVDTSTIRSFTITQNVTLEWSDTAPGVDPPPSSSHDARRIRFIYDFFLTHAKPNGSSVKETITDEVTIDLSGNPLFPGSQPPGCLDPNSRYGNQTTGPVVKNAVFDGYNYYDYWYTDHHDLVPGTGTRYSSFRRVGGTASGAQPPLKVDLKPFFAAIKREWPGPQEAPVGPWLGQITLATELYDHCSGSITFHAPPTFEPQYMQPSEAL